MEEAQKDAQDTQDTQDVKDMQVFEIDDPTKFDYSEEYYKSAEYFKQEFPCFPSDEFYEVLELHARGVTPKQFKVMKKKEAKKKAKRVGKKTKNL